MFYIGKHLGSINDGYICSSKMMLRDYKKNPDHFKRRILHYFIDPTGSLSLEKECQWLALIKEEDLGIFSVNDQIIVAYFYYNETTISLQDYFTNKNLLFLKPEINIIGRVEAIIDYNMHKK